MLTIVSGVGLFGDAGRILPCSPEDAQRRALPCRVWQTLPSQRFSSRRCDKYITGDLLGLDFRNGRPTGSLGVAAAIMRCPSAWEPAPSLPSWLESP